MRALSIAAVVGVASLARGTTASAQCSLSADPVVCETVSRGDQAHREAVRAVPGRRAPDASLQGHSEALRLYREACARMGSAVHHDLLGRIARELYDTEQWDEALLSAQECLAQAETDLEHPDRADQECRSEGLTPSRQRTCQTYTSCSVIVRALQTVRASAGRPLARFGRVVVGLPPRLPPGARVYLAGNNLPLSFQVEGFPVAAGDVLVEAEAPGYRRFSRSVGVTPGATVSVAVELVALARDVPEPPPTTDVLRDARAALMTVATAHQRVDELHSRDLTSSCTANRLDSLDDILLDARVHFARSRGAYLTRNDVRLRDEARHLSELRARAEEIAAAAVQCETHPAREAGPSTAGRVAIAVPNQAAPTRHVHPAAWATLGVGGATLVTAGVMLALRAGTIDTLDGQCGGEGMRLCPESSRSVYDQGVLYNTLANVTLLTGAALLVGGAVWAIVDARAGRSQGTARTAWTPLVGTDGAGIQGRF